MSAVLGFSEKCLRALSLAAAVVGGVAMVVMLCIITANIVLRPFGESVRGTVEVSGYLCALAVGLCLPAAQRAGSHISAGLWVSSLPRFVRQLQNAAGSAVCAGLLLLAARELFSIAEYAHDMGEYIEGFDISYAFMAVGFAFGAALHAALFLASLGRMCLPAKETA